MATISADPRFQLAQALRSGEGGGPEAAINIFANLLDMSRETQGETSLNAALCQYEYGNALFRAVVRKKEVAEDDDNVEGGDGERKHGKQEEEEENKKPEAKKESQREIMAAAALKRSAVSGDSTSSSGKRFKVGDDSLENEAVLKQGDEAHSKNNIDGRLSSANETVQAKMEDDASSGDENDEEEDVALALEMMETSLAILLPHATNEDGSTKNEQKQQQWALGQLPRILVCIGDLHSFRGQFGDAADAYCRALPYREEACKCLKQIYAKNSDKAEPLTMEALQCQRHLVETYALVTEALLACHKGEDVVCHHNDDDDENGEGSAVAAKGSKGGEGSEKTKGRVLVPAKERMSFAESHYELAREGLEDLLYRMGKMAAAKMEIGNERKDIGYAVMMVVGIGNSIKDEN